MSRRENANLENATREANLADLLGAPAILPGESENRYAALQAEVGRTIKPQNIFDWLRVRTITDAVWEEMRYKGLESKLIEGSKVNALAVLLTPHCGFYQKRAAELAADYYSPDPKRSEPAVRRVAWFGITQEMINAKAASIEGANLVLLDRLIGNRQNCNRSLIKEHERRQRKTEKSEKRRTNGSRPPEKERVIS